MKTYFIRLFNYDRFANHLILETIINAGSPEKPIQLMAHLLAAQQTWLNRCKGDTVIGGALWPDWKAETLGKMIDDNHRAFINFLDYSDPDDFHKEISYKNSKGDSFENQLNDILTQVTNHGTHHRAQAGQLLKLASVENLPTTDYIFYLRQ